MANSLALAMDEEMEVVEIRICIGEEVKDSVCMHRAEIGKMIELAYTVLAQRAEQVLNGKVLKRITYIDDEGDHCTLSPASVVDAVDLSRDGVLNLYAVEEPSQDQEAEASPVLEVTHSKLKLEAATFQEGMKAWSDRNYVYKNIPDELLGSTLFRGEHIVPTNTFFLVKAPAGSVIYVFSEVHRDGGFSNLGLEKCDAKRFRWEIEGSGKHYSLSLWKFISTGEAEQILVCESLVGGIAVKTGRSTTSTTNSKAEAETAGKMIEKLAALVGEPNVLMTLQKLAEKGLDLLAEHEDHFTDAWVPLIQPLDLAASGNFADTKEVMSFLQTAKDVYQTMPSALQEVVEKSLKGTLQNIVAQQAQQAAEEAQQAAEEATETEIHPHVVCDGCEQDPLTGRRYKCSDCRDFDLCESCYKKRDRLHPGHSFKIVPGHVLPFPLELSVCCDGCGKKQVQPQDRFKCLECPDYDLCTSCFEQRSLIHPEHSTWQHLGQRLCWGSAPPAEPEPESGHEEKLAEPKNEFPDMPMFEADAMMACPCTPDLLDAQADVAAAMAVPCTPPPLAVPCTPTSPDEKEVPAALVSCPSTPPEPKLAWVPQPCTPPLSTEEKLDTVSESEIDPKVAVAAMAKLLSNPNKALRQAVVHAMSVAEVEVAARTPVEQSQDSGSDISDDWERLEEAENEDVPMGVASPTPSQKPEQLVKVVFVSALLNDPTTMQQLQNKQGVIEWHGSEAFRLGHLEIKHTACPPPTKALVKIVVVNIGEAAWPEASTLELRDGPSWGFDKMPLGAVTPGETVELVLDLSFTAGHQGDMLTSAWAVMDGQGSPIGPPMLLEVVRT